MAKREHVWQHQAPRPQPQLAGDEAKKTGQRRPVEESKRLNCELPP